MNPDKIKILLIAINIITFLAFGYDKLSAKKDKWRVPEKTLLTLSFLFGGIGAFLGMKLFKHKTKKPIFVLVIPIIMVLQFMIIMIYMYYER